MARSRSILATLLVVDALLLAMYLPTTFVSQPAKPSGFLAPEAATAAALLAATQFPELASAAEKWEYKEPTGSILPGQTFILISFFFIHAAGVADFYAKKVGSGPAVPWNIFREKSITSTFKVQDFQ